MEGFLSSSLSEKVALRFAKQYSYNSLIEIDQIDETRESPAGVTTGMTCVAFHCRGEADENSLHCEDGPFAGQRATNFIGSAGERYTLVYA